MHIIFTRIGCTLFTCDMYMCRLRHINDPVLSSLKMKGIRYLFIYFIYLFYLFILFIYLFIYLSMLYLTYLIVLHTLVAGSLARSQYPEGPATGQPGISFSWFPYVYKPKLKWFPKTPSCYCKLSM
jgi:hypothetical protein